MIKRSHPLVQVNKVAAVPCGETPGQEKDLIAPNNKLNFQDLQRKGIETELMAANKKLAVEDKEKEKRSAALIIAKKKLFIENKEKGKRAAELIIAKKKLTFESKEKRKRAAELIMTKKELVLRNEEKEKFADELITAQKDLVKAENLIKEHISGLEEIMFITSHKVRQPIANILGIANILDQFLKAPATIKKMVGYIKQSTLSLDGFTRELSLFISVLKKRK